MVDRDAEVSRRRSGVDPEAVVEPTGVVNGASWSGHERNHYWRNLGGQAFQEQSGISGADAIGDGRTFSLLDYDRDGFQDFVLVSANRPFVQLFRNRQGEAGGADNHVLALRLIGGARGGEVADADGKPWSNRDAIGAVVSLTAGDLQLTRELRAGEGLSGQNSQTLRLGLGTASQATAVSIRWPSGRVSRVDELPAGYLVTIRERPQADEAGVELTPLRPAKAIVRAAPATDAVTPSPAEPLLQTLTTAAGAEPSAYRLIMTWFTTCQACKRAEPTLAALRRAFPEQRLAILGFNNDGGDSAADMADYEARFQPAFRNIPREKGQIDDFKALQERHAPAGHDFSEQAYSSMTPATLLVDAEGRVLQSWAGVPSVSELRRLLAGL